VKTSRHSRKLVVMSNLVLSEEEVGAFAEKGFVVCSKLLSVNVCKHLKQIAEMHLDDLIAPIEYEVDVLYPGSPEDINAVGGKTSRRLLQAYARDAAFRDWATSPEVRCALGQLFGSPTGIMMSQCHHNCVMTKEPGFSSATLWHQDIRYWSFDQENLISVWLALAEENKANGCLRVIPGSHRQELDRGRLDASLFLRPNLPENKEMLKNAELVELQAGDALFFHCRLFHAAGRNLTSRPKLSPVFTYHQSGNRPIEGTRSANYPSIPLPEKLL